MMISFSAQTLTNKIHRVGVKAKLLTKYK